MSFCHFCDSHRHRFVPSQKIRPYWSLKKQGCLFKRKGLYIPYIPWVLTHWPVTVIKDWPFGSYTFLFGTYRLGAVTLPPIIMEVENDSIWNVVVTLDGLIFEWTMIMRGRIYPWKSKAIKKIVPWKLIINPYKTNGLFQKTIHLMVFGPPGFTSTGLLGTIQPQLGRELQQVRLFGGTLLNVFPGYSRNPLWECGGVNDSCQHIIW